MDKLFEETIMLPNQVYKITKNQYLKDQIICVINDVTKFH